MHSQAEILSNNPTLKQGWIDIILKERKKPYAPYIPLEKTRIKVKGTTYPLQFSLIGDNPSSFELVFLVKDGEEWLDLYRIWFLDGELEAASYLPTNLSRLWEAYKLKENRSDLYSEFQPLDKDCWIAVSLKGTFLIDGTNNSVTQVTTQQENYASNSR
jgi:hypothetical protein